MLRTTLATALPRRSVGAARSFHASPAAYKTVTEKVKEAANNVNLKMGQTLAKGIEKGEEVTEKTQETAGTVKAKAQETGGNVKSKAEETAGTAKEKAGETGEVAKQNANQASAGATEVTEDIKKDSLKK